jgi:phenylacetate-CoA ligase
LAWPENLSIQGFPEIVLTTLVNRAMPLIRYRTGDLGLVESAAGGGFTLSRLQGRVHEIFMLDEHSYTTSFMSTFLHSRFRIHDFQIIQRETRVPEFRIVTDHPDELSGIEDALLSLCGVPVKATRIRTTDLLRRGRQMKFSHLVREDAKGTLGTDLK